MQISTHLQAILKALPDKPGVYQYYDADGKILYVGKAKSLRKRVTSYFQKEVHESGKTTVLVRKIADIKLILVDTELDALLLENNLIKKYQPRYNVLLKDDKTFPWICVKNERFPRVFSTRNPIKDGSTYFGPYANVKIMHALLDLVKHLFPLRTCNLLLTDSQINSHKYKVCMEYHLKNCLGPCEGLQSEEHYAENIKQIKEILRGNLGNVTRFLKTAMQDAAQVLEFEKAHLLKEKLALLEKYQSKSTVVSPLIHNVEVYSIASDEKSAYINFFKVANGAIIQGHTIEYKKRLDESDEELLSMAIVELRERFQSDAKECLVPFLPDLVLPGVIFSVPQRGDKKALLELSERNVEFYRKEKQRQDELVDPDRHTKRIMQQMMKDLRMPVEPRHIECFDNSNFQGAYPVSAMTVFKDGKPSKRDYRHFNVNTVEGPDDFATMEEVIYRRYKRLVEEQQPLPQLIVIDGGKGQLSSALNSLEKLGLRGKITIIGIAKRLEEIYFPGDSLPLYIDKKSETLRIIQQIRDEAHRFGITHHRKRREKGTIQTELTQIKGISKVTADKLLRTFKSVKGVKAATAEQLQEVIGKAKAMLVYAYFNAHTPGEESQRG